MNDIPDKSGVSLRGVAPLWSFPVLPSRSCLDAPVADPDFRSDFPCLHHKRVFSDSDSGPSGVPRAEARAATSAESGPRSVPVPPRLRPHHRRRSVAAGLGLQGTEFARAQCTTIRLKLLKIGARIRLTVRNVWISMSEDQVSTSRWTVASQVEQRSNR